MLAINLSDVVHLLFNVLLWCLPIGLLLLWFFVSVACAFAVYGDAVERKNSHRHSWPVGPFFWSIIVFFTGIVGAASYWIIQTSDLGRQKNTLPEFRGKTFQDEHNDWANPPPPPKNIDPETGLNPNLARLQKQREPKPLIVANEDNLEVETPEKLEPGSDDDQDTQETS